MHEYVCMYVDGWRSFIDGTYYTISWRLYFAHLKLSHDRPIPISVCRNRNSYPLFFLVQLLFLPGRLLLLLDAVAVRDAAASDGWPKDAHTQPSKFIYVRVAAPLTSLDMSMYSFRHSS
jgi:hypothetical protein